MKNDKLSQIWNSQTFDSLIEHPDYIIKKAKSQRNGRFISIAVMSTTLLVLLIYAAFYVGNNWNSFTLGIVLMISSLAFRIILGFISLYRKESQLISLDNQAFKKYLKRYYKIRLKINYIITPICFITYILGFIMLLPYFKQMFSKGFYTYILISGFISLLAIAVIIINTIRKEHIFLNLLDRK